METAKKLLLKDEAADCIKSDSKP